DWDPARSPMQTAQGVWATAVRLAPGRYRYAFLVNGVDWRADPGAPTARDDEFGTASSVVTVGGGGTGVSSRCSWLCSVQPLTLARSVRTDLGARGLPSDTAAADVLALAPHARDADLVEFRRAVERAIALGPPPRPATSHRVNAGAENFFTRTGTNPGPVP